METVKRVRYFEGEFLHEADFIAEQEYHRGQQLRHNRLLHTPGIAEGLEVTAQNGSQSISVSKGTAIDGEGQPIVLLEDSSISIPGSITGSQNMLVVISLAPKEADPDMNGGNTRYSEEPLIELVDTIKPAHVQLARVSVENGRVKGAVDTSIRQAAAARMGEDVTLPGALTVAKAATLNQGLVVTSGNVGIGTTNPQESLQIGTGMVFHNGGHKVIGFGWSPLSTKCLQDNCFPAEIRWDPSNGVLGLGIDATKRAINSPPKIEPLLTISSKGNVGIGTTTPKIHVVGDLVLGIDESNKKFIIHPRTNGQGDFLKITSDKTDGSWDWDHGIALKRGGDVEILGNVGIGTSNPTQAKLVVSGSVTTQVNGGYGYLSKGGAGTYLPTATVPYSIFASDRMAASEFNAFSDERIKNIQRQSDSTMDLQKLLGIEIMDFCYKDVVGKGNAPHKKVIAQQVEKIFPEAVSQHIDIVPDIYRKAEVNDGWVKLATNLKKGERVRLIGENKEDIHEVLEVAEGKFRTDFTAESNDVFVYGREVKDFRTVDYDAISMLNVSATQQIKKEKDAEVKALQGEDAILKNQLAEQEKRISQLEAKGAKLEAMLTRLLENTPLTAVSPA